MRRILQAYLIGWIIVLCFQLYTIATQEPAHSPIDIKKEQQYIKAITKARIATEQAHLEAMNTCKKH